MKRPTRTKARSCTGKKRHDSSQAARAQLRNLLSKGRVRLSVYACKFCGGFHVGHSTKPRD